MASYLKKTGGLTAAAERSMLKSQLLYDYIDKSDGYYLAPVEIGSRSRMNVPFRVRNKRTGIVCIIYRVDYYITDETFPFSGWTR